MLLRTARTLGTAVFGVSGVLGVLSGGGVLLGPGGVRLGSGGSLLRRLLGRRHAAASAGRPVLLDGRGLGLLSGLRLYGLWPYGLGLPRLWLHGLQLRLRGLRSRARLRVRG
ncbi:hypothetical protein, partial [Streptomyces atacamensis]|uniref:hypothetical protein n=1 Tax=Streptomyces atacamensis TaxID=531966 RepID=UPI00399CA836